MTNYCISCRLIVHGQYSFQSDIHGKKNSSKVSEQQESYESIIIIIAIYLKNNGVKA